MVHTKEVHFWGVAITPGARGSTSDAISAGYTQRSPGQSVGLRHAFEKRVSTPSSPIMKLSHNTSQPRTDLQNTSCNKLRTLFIYNSSDCSHASLAPFLSIITSLANHTTVLLKRSHRREKKLQKTRTHTSPARMRNNYSYSTITVR